MPQPDARPQAQHGERPAAPPANLPADLHARLCALLPELAREVFAAQVDTRAKGSDGLDLVTSIDLAMQARLEQALPELLPGSEVRGEEGYTPASDQTAPLWLVDPLDGTVNFVAALPAYAIAVVLIQAGQPVLAAVYDLPQGDVYSAQAGGGARLNGAPLHPARHPARLAVLSSGLLRDLARHSPDVLVDLLAEFKLRNFGSQALHLCYAAAGKLSLVASREAKGWDDLAGALIAREAGLQFGHYGPPPTALDMDQHSLCAAPEIFATYARHLARARA